MGVLYIPVWIRALLALLVLIAWIPLSVFLALLGVSAMYARILAAFVVCVPLLFIVGLNTNKKLFLAIMLIMGCVLVIGFFLFW